MIRCGGALAVLLCAVAMAAAARETVEVSADKVLGPFTQRGTGFIQGPFSNDEPAEELVAPLKVRRFRGTEKDVVGAYQRCKASGATMEVVTNNWTAWDKPPRSGPMTSRLTASDSMPCSVSCFRPRRRSRIST
jgi:hypothetical protein